VELDRDEVPRPDTSLEKLAALPTVYGSSTVTAGNAPDLSSGASALVLASGAAVEGRSAAVRGWLTAFAMASGDPHRIGYMAAQAALTAMRRAGLTLDDVHLFEI